MARAFPLTQIHHGFTLVEVLISLLIVAIGITGALRLQIASAQALQQSVYMKAANALAIEMSDKIAGNAMLMNHSTQNPYVNVNFQDGQNQIGSVASCYQNQCSTEQLAAADISEWLQSIQSALPNAHAVICRDDSVTDFGWECRGGNAQAGIVIKLGWANKNEPKKLPAPQLIVPAVALGE